MPDHNPDDYRVLATLVCLKDAKAFDSFVFKDKNIAVISVEVCHRHGSVALIGVIQDSHMEGPTEEKKRCLSGTFVALGDAMLEDKPKPASKASGNN